MIQIQAGNEIDPFGLGANDCICDQSTVDVIINIDSSGAQLFDKDRYDVCKYHWLLCYESSHSMVCAQCWLLIYMLTYFYTIIFFH